MSKLKKLIKGVGAGAGVGLLAGLAMSGYGKSQATKKPSLKIKKTPKSDKKTFSLTRRKGDTFGADTAQDYEASRPFDTFGAGTAQDYAASRPKDTFASDTPKPVGFEYEQGIEGTFGPMAKKGKFIVKKAKIGLFGRVPKQVADDKDRLTNTDIEDMIAAGNFAGTISPYLKKRDRDRLNKDIEEAQKNFYKKRNKDLTATEGSFMRGGSVVARGDKFSRNRSRPTKLS